MSAVAPIAEAQQPIRIGASVAQTGAYAALGQNQLRGYQLWAKHTNDKGGVLGRRLELVAEDDRSEPATAARIYEALITKSKVDAVLGPYSSPITEAVADVTEKHRIALVAPAAAATSLFKKGRKFVFMLASRAEVYLEGLIDMAARRGLKTVAVTHEDTLALKAIAQGTLELAKKRGLSVVLVETYPKGTTDLLPDPAVESAPVSHARNVFAVAVFAALAWAVAPVAHAQPPIRTVTSITQGAD